MVGGDLVVAETFGELVGDSFGHAAGVHEDQRGVVLLDHLGDVVEQLGHLLGRRKRLELAVGQHELEIEVTA